MNRRKLLRATLLSLLVLPILILGTLTFSLPSAAQTGQLADPTGVWLDVVESSIAAPPGTRRIIPQRYRTVAINRVTFTNLLRQAPMEFTPAALVGGQVEFTLPTPDGGFARFRVEESPIMEPALAAHYPEIKTYRGQGVDDRTATTRFGWTRAGFHAIVISSKGTFYIDPYRRNSTLHYLVYHKRDLGGDKRFDCKFDEVNPSGAAAAPGGEEFAPDVVSAGTLRSYRLALAATGEYTMFFSELLDSDEVKKDKAFAALTATMNRVNGIYERDLSVRMMFIAQERNIIYTNPAADPYPNDPVGVSMLAANQANLDAPNPPGPVGEPNYDIGHVVSTGFGGVAFLASVCDRGNPNIPGDGSNAGGYTGLDNPVGDGFDIDFVAHEMGHQFGGNHTFNGQTGSCSGTNREASAAFEPGSATTIMGYAGICGAQDLQPHSDADFHVRSLEEIVTFVNGAGDSCSTHSNVVNTAPTVNAGIDYTIPKNTPFTLIASGSDIDGDLLTYDWEEYDLGPAATAGNDRDSDGQPRPIFRSYLPTTSTSRTFPSLQYILNNANTPPTTYDCGRGAPCLTGEILPQIQRTMNFQVTARDNHAVGGGIRSDLMQVNVRGDSGPFLVTSPNTAITWPSSSMQNVTWNVANTTAAPVSATSVNILLSTDGGFTFPITLAAGVPNDGSQQVTAPNLATTQARVRVEAVGNIFFDISNTNFTIQAVAGAPVALDDTASTAFNTPVLIDVLANDSDPDGQPLAITAIQSPTAQGGTATLNNNGTPGDTTDDRINYTPANAFSGADTFNYTITAGSDSDSATVTVNVAPGCPPTPTGSFSDTFDPAQPGWVVDTNINAVPASQPWSVLPDGTAHSATNSYKTDASTVDEKDDRLIAPPQDLSSTSHLIFWHRFNTEDSYDGGVLEVSTNGGTTWVDVETPAGTQFVTGGYNGTIDTGFNSQIAGRAAWTGLPLSPTAMTMVEVDLGAFAGVDRLIRWRYVADPFTPGALAGESWAIDDVQFTDLNVVTAVCPLAPIAGNDSAATDAGVPVTIDVLANDTDSNNDPMTVTNVTDPPHGVVVINMDGTVTYTPDGGFSGTDQFDYTVCDPGLLCDTATVTVTVQAVGGAVNYALTALNSAPAASSSFAGERSYPAETAFDGSNTGAGWEQGGGWNDATRDVWPDWLSVSFGGGAKTINEIRVYTLQNNYHSPVTPDQNTDASTYGILDFQVQTWNGSAWVTVPGGTITGNTKALRVITLGTPITTTGVRIFVTNGRVYYSRIVELECYGPSGQSTQ